MRERQSITVTNSCKKSCMKRLCGIERRVMSLPQPTCVEQEITRDQNSLIPN